MPAIPPVAKPSLPPLITVGFQPLKDSKASSLAPALSASRFFSNCLKGDSSLTLVLVSGLQ